jgi:hypothetical protein
MSAKKRDNSRYKLQTVTRACTIVRHFSDVQQALGPGDVVERTGLERTIVFRILKTLEEKGPAATARWGNVTSPISV